MLSLVETFVELLWFAHYHYYYHNWKKENKNDFFSFTTMHCERSEPYVSFLYKYTSVQVCKKCKRLQVYKYTSVQVYKWTLYKLLSYKYIVHIHTYNCLSVQLFKCKCTSASVQVQVHKCISFENKYCLLRSQSYKLRHLEYLCSNLW